MKENVAARVERLAAVIAPRRVVVLAEVRAATAVVAVVQANATLHALQIAKTTANQLALMGVAVDVQVNVLLLVPRIAKTIVRWIVEAQPQGNATIVQSNAHNIVVQYVQMPVKEPAIIVVRWLVTDIVILHVLVGPKTVASVAMELVQEDAELAVQLIATMLVRSHAKERQVNTNIYYI